jgi:hypothetical protein
MVYEFWQWKVSDFNTHSPKFMTLGVEWNPVGAPPVAAAAHERVDAILNYSHPSALFGSRTHISMLHIFTHTDAAEKWKVFDFRSRRVRYKAKRRLSLSIVDTKQNGGI